MLEHQKKKKETASYGIIGLEAFGASLAVSLADSGADVLAIDTDTERVAALHERGIRTLCLPQLDRKALAGSGICDCRVAVVCIREPLGTSILTVLYLTSMGIPTVLAEAGSDEHQLILEKLGAEVIYPERDMAQRLARRLKTDSVVNFVDLSEKIHINKVIAPSHIIGKTVLDIDVRFRYGLNIIAIENNGQMVETVRPDYVFRKDDVIYLCGSREGLIKLYNRLNT